MLFHAGGGEAGVLVHVLRFFFLAHCDGVL